MERDKIKIYKLTWTNNHEGFIIFWAKSKKEATSKWLALTKDDGNSGFILHKVLFPATKPLILAWLNTHFTTDNG